MIGVRGGICKSSNRYVKANKKYMKEYDTNKETSCLKYWDVNNLYSWTILPVDDFEWVEDINEFGKSFVKSYNEQSDERYFLDNDVQYPEKLHELHNNIPFLPEWLKIEKSKSLLLIYMIKLNMLFT